MENELYDAVNSVIRYNSKYSELTRRLIKSFPEIKSRENVVFSTLSIIMLLGIVTESVAGPTRDEILKVLGEKYSYENLRSILCDTSYCDIIILFLFILLYSLYNSHDLNRINLCVWYIIWRR